MKTERLSGGRLDGCASSMGAAIGPARRYALTAHFDGPAGPKFQPAPVGRHFVDFSATSGFCSALLLGPLPVYLADPAASLTRITTAPHALKHGDDVPVIHTRGVLEDDDKCAIMEPVVCPAVRVGNGDACAHGIHITNPARGSWHA